MGSLAVVCGTGLTEGPSSLVFKGYTVRTEFFIEAPMYAVFRTGGKQFRAEPGKKIRVPTLDVEPGESITFEDVLLTSDGDSVQVGAPTLKGAKVKGEILRHGRDKKIIVFKRRRRKNSRRKQGHRQGFTEVRVDEILV
jgi:large subunit ribosomal protein L21